MALIIRQAAAEDGRAISAIYEPYVTGTAITFEETPPVPDEMSARITDTLARYPYLVAVDDAKVVGYAYAGAHQPRASFRWSVDVAIYIAMGHHRRGIGRALYRQLLPLLESQHYAMAYAGITLPNAASVGLHESVGFSRVAIFCNVGFKMGAWRDVGWWERPLAKPNVPPMEPIARETMPKFAPITIA